MTWIRRSGQATGRGSCQGRTSWSPCAWMRTGTDCGSGQRRPTSELIRKATDKRAEQTLRSAAAVDAPEDRRTQGISGSDGISRG